MKYKLVEKDNHNVVHALFDSKDRAEQHLSETIPKYIARSLFTNKSLTAESFEIIKER